MPTPVLFILTLSCPPVTKVIKSLLEWPYILVSAETPPNLTKPPSDTTKSSPAITSEVALISPATSSLYVGLVVPMPTFPAAVIIIFEVLRAVAGVILEEPEFV